MRDCRSNNNRFTAKSADDHPPSGVASGPGSRKSTGCGRLGTGLLLLPVAGVLSCHVEALNAAPQARSRDSIEIVTVTAQKREEVSQNVPLAISTLNSDALTKAGIVTLGDIQEKVPSLSISPFNTTSSTMVVFMRGVGAQDTEQPTRDAGVGIYLDDIYLGRAQGLTSEMADLDRIEVLKGPQGTLYGRNTIGGAVKFITKKPTGVWGFKQTLDVANGGRYRALTSLNLPEAYNVSAKLSYLRTNRDGLVRNPGSGGDFGKQADAGYRVALRWTPAAEVTVDYVHDHSHQDGTPLYVQRFTGGSAPYGVPVPLHSSRLGTAWRGSDLKQQDDYTADGNALTIQWDINGSTTLKSISSQRRLQSARLLDGENAYGLASLQYGSLDMKELSQEFLLSGIFDLPKINYVAGVNYYRGYGDYATSTLLGALPVVDGTYRPPTMADAPVPIISDFENKSHAVYGQVSWTPAILNEKLDLIAGARYTVDNRSNQRTQGGALYDTEKGETRYSSFDPAFTIDYRWLDNFHTYFRVAKAFRAGGFNVRSYKDEAAYSPEHLTAYELGLKSDWWDNRFQLNAAAFISKYRDIQIDGYDSSFHVHTVNAGDAIVNGFELDTVFIPVTGLEVSADYTYLDWRPDGDLSFGFPLARPAPLQLPNLPEHKYDIALEYTFEPLDIGELSARADYSWTDVTSPGTANERPSYGLLNARLALSGIAVGSDGARLDTALYAKNLLDKSYVTFNTLGGGAFGEKRVVGISLTYNY